MRSFPFFIVAVASTVALASSVSADSVSRARLRPEALIAPLRAPSWLIPAPGKGRTLPPTVGPRRTLSRMRRLAGTTRYVIRDLGVPAGLQDPMPFAINQEGDVALQMCPSGGCAFNSNLTGTWYPYLYDFRTRGCCRSRASAPTRANSISRRGSTTAAKSSDLFIFTMGRT